MDYDLAILGAGAAGMMAAVTAGECSRDAETGRSRLKIGLFEKNPQAGIKVLVCGGGRCNFTNAGSVDFLIAQFGRNGRFLTLALRHLDNQGLRDFFAARGVPSHEEPGGKIYPDSNQAKSVVDALLRSIRELGVDVFTGARGTVTMLQREEVFTITTADDEAHTAAAVILAVGGMSYQRMGTIGDGYRFAESLGHSILTPRPAIVGLLTQEQWPKDMQGLAVRDVEVTIEAAGKRLAAEHRRSVHDLLFTHFGLSGPVILNPSEVVAELLEKSPAPATVSIRIDFARHHSQEKLHRLMRNWQQHHGKKQLKTMLSQNTPDVTITSTSPDQTAIEGDARNRTGDFAIPHRLAEKLCQLENISPAQACAALTAAQIHRLVEVLKNSRFTVTGTRGFKEAMVTAGGISLAEVEPKTMESRIVPGLYLTGEVLDLTGPSGGYNLQLAFSTGALAGCTVGRKLTS